MITRPFSGSLLKEFKVAGSKAPLFLLFFFLLALAMLFASIYIYIYVYIRWYLISRARDKFRDGRLIDGAHEFSQM